MQFSVRTAIKRVKRTLVQAVPVEQNFQLWTVNCKLFSMAERPVLVGVFPEVVVLDPGDQVTWICDAGNLRIEFDVNRCPFGSNVFQAPVGMRLQTGPPRPGTKVGSYKYRLWINEQLVGRGEVLLRD